MEEYIDNPHDPNSWYDKDGVAFGKYAYQRRRFLWNNRRLEHNIMQAEGKLESHLASVQARCRRRVDEFMDVMPARRGITEELKEHDPMKWVREMNALKMQIEEIINDEIIYN